MVWVDESKTADSTTNLTPSSSKLVVEAVGATESLKKGRQWRAKAVDVVGPVYDYRA
jgi:hypothetical protein